MHLGLLFKPQPGFIRGSGGYPSISGVQMIALIVVGVTIVVAFQLLKLALMFLEWLLSKI